MYICVVLQQPLIDLMYKREVSKKESFFKSKNWRKRRLQNIPIIVLSYIIAKNPDFGGF